MPLLRSVAKTLSRKIPAPWIALLLFFLLATNIFVLWSTNSQSVLFAEWLPSIVGNDEQQVGSHVWRRTREPTPLVEVNDRHPVRKLMRLADRKFEQYNTGRSRTFTSVSLPRSLPASLPASLPTSHPLLMLEKDVSSLLGIIL